MPPIEYKPEHLQELLPPPKLNSKWTFINRFSKANLRIQELINLHNKIKEAQAKAAIKNDPKASDKDPSLLKSIRQSFISKTNKETKASRANAAIAFHNRAQELIEEYKKKYEEHKRKEAEKSRAKTAFLAPSKSGLQPNTLGGSRKIRKTTIKYKNNRTRRTRITRVLHKNTIL